MLKACVSYSKKVPVDGLEFSSQGYSLTLETEIPETDAAAIQSRLRDTFELVKSSVEQELANGHGRPAAQAAPTRPSADAGATAPNGDSRPAARAVEGGRGSSVDRASNRQIKFLTDLWTQGGGAVADLNARIRAKCGVDGLYELSRKQASVLLDELQREVRKAA